MKSMQCKYKSQYSYQTMDKTQKLFLIFLLFKYYWFCLQILKELIATYEQTKQMQLDAEMNMKTYEHMLKRMKVNYL